MLYSPTVRASRKGAHSQRIARLARWFIAIPALVGAAITAPFLATGTYSGAWLILGIVALVLLGLALTATIKPPRVWVGLTYLGVWSLVSIASMQLILRAFA